MSDSARLMQYDANKKSAVVAYLLWFFVALATQLSAGGVAGSSVMDRMKSPQ